MRVPNERSSVPVIEGASNWPLRTEDNVRPLQWLLRSDASGQWIVCERNEFSVECLEPKKRPFNSRAWKVA